MLAQSQTLRCKSHVSLISGSMSRRWCKSLFHSGPETSPRANIAVTRKPYSRWPSLRAITIPSPLSMSFARDSASARLITDKWTPFGLHLWSLSTTAFYLRKEREQKTVKDNAEQKTFCDFQLFMSPQASIMHSFG